MGYEQAMDIAETVRPWQSISTRIAVAFLLVALLPLVFALTYAYSTSSNALRDEVGQRLYLAGDNKANRLEGYLGGLRREVEGIASSPDLLALVSGGEFGKEDEMHALLHHYSDAFSYPSMVFLPIDGEAGFDRTLKLGHHEDVAPSFLAQRNKTIDSILSRVKSGVFDAVITPFVLGDSDFLKSHIFAPVVKNGNIVGVLIAEIDSQRLFAIVDDRSGLGETGDVFILRGDLDNIETANLFLSSPSGPIAFSPEAEKKSLKRLEASQAFSEGYGRLDISGDMVAVSEVLPSFGWRVVVCLHNAEAFRSVEQQKVAGIVLFSVTALIVIALSVLLGRAISVRIRRLSKATRDYAVGGVPSHVDVRGVDEIAILGTGFNEMIDLVLDYQGQAETNLAEQVKLGDELKGANEEMCRALEVAEQLSRSKSEFLANMSHEIRTPLNGVLGFAEILISTTENPSDLKKLNLIKQCGQSLLEILNDILDISRLEAGRIDLEDEPVNLRDLTTFVSEAFSFKVNEKRIELRTEVAPGLPSVVGIDPIRLRQIVFNLVGNAIKFTDEGEVLIEISEAAANESGEAQIEICVKDSGIGISKEAMLLIFDRFSQERRSQQKLYGGAGLGLAICKELTELMGGRIWARSVVGKGSSFTVRLPIREVEALAVVIDAAQ